MQRKSIIIIVLVAVVVLCTKLFTRPAEKDYIHLSGIVFHTSYNISYEGETSYHDSIRQLFDEFDGSLSMFNDTSIITRMNRNDTTVTANPYVKRVLQKAFEVSEATDGAFDITVAPLVNLWGFGFKNSENVTDSMVRERLAYVGYRSIALDELGHLQKEDPRTIIDASSIAKGYMCDVVADFLQDHGISNYMVEIGGEIALKGVNAKGNTWTVGINKPIEDSTSTRNELQEVLQLSAGGMATSGNYRNFYVKDGKKYAHTIDPQTGCPVQHSVLSATVIAPTCMEADAFATACMVMGEDSARAIASRQPELQIYLITDESTPVQE